MRELTSHRHGRAASRFRGLALAAAFAAVVTPATADPMRSGGDPGQPGARGHVGTSPVQVPARVGATVPGNPIRPPGIGATQGRGGSDQGADPLLGVLPSPAQSGGDTLASADTAPVQATTEHFCSDEDGVSLPANKDSVCPEGTTKVSVTNCEAGEECNLQPRPRT